MKNLKNSLQTFVSANAELSKSAKLAQKLPKSIKNLVGATGISVATFATPACASIDMDRVIEIALAENAKANSTQVYSSKSQQSFNYVYSNQLDDYEEIKEYFSKDVLPYVALNFVENFENDGEIFSDVSDEIKEKYKVKYIDINTIALYLKNAGNVNIANSLKLQPELTQHFLQGRDISVWDEESFSQEVKNIQYNSGIKVDGIIGTETAKYIFEIYE